jgi:SAM-dependent methyltransferase
MIDSLKKSIKRSKWALIAYTIVHSSAVRGKANFGNFKSITGATHVGLSISDSVSYIERQYDDYIRYGKLSAADIEDKVVYEGGPGDNVGVGLRFLAAGAKYAVCMDRFDSRHNPEQEHAIYEELRRRLNDQERSRLDQAVDLSAGKINLNPDKFRAVYGHGMEEVGDVFDANTFDLLVSRGVVQEIYDGNRLFAGMYKVLKPGGLMLHKIDLRDYGLFSSNGHNPLTFLTVSDSVYRLMASGSDRPSPRMLNWYRDKVKELGMDAQFYRSATIQRQYNRMPVEVIPHKQNLQVGVDYPADTAALVKEIRPQILPRYRDLSEEDLITAGVFLVARKPVA